MLVSAEKDLVRSQTLALKDFETQQSVDQQQAKVDQLKASIEADKAAIETAQTQLDYTNIVAPIDGRIGMRLVDPGNILRATDAGSSLAWCRRNRRRSCSRCRRNNSRMCARRARGPVEVTAFDQDDRRPLSDRHARC